MVTRITKPSSLGSDKPVPTDPPDFTIKAADILAPRVILAWITKAGDLGVNDDKLTGAWQHYLNVLAWQRANPDKVKVPD
jgi:hypothetical protein